MHAGLGKFSIQYLYLAICIASPVQEHMKKNSIPLKLKAFHFDLVACQAKNILDCVAMFIARCQAQRLTVVKSIRARMLSVERMMNNNKHTDLKVDSNLLYTFSNN